MSDIEINGRSLRFGEFAEELIAAASSMSAGEMSAQYGSSLGALNEDQACQLRVAVQSISTLATDSNSGEYLVSPDLETSITNFIESHKDGASRSSCDVPQIQAQDMDIKVDGMKL